MIYIKICKEYLNSSYFNTEYYIINSHFNGQKIKIKIT